jgi:hypothetical protein
MHYHIQKVFGYRYIEGKTVKRETATHHSQHRSAYSKISIIPTEYSGYQTHVTQQAV